jgi:hypothetical protein
MGGNMQKILLVVGAVALTACGEAKQGFEDGFDTKFHESFVASCVKSSTGAGAPQAAADAICACASDKIKDRFSTREKMSLKNDQIIPVVQECSDSYRG